MKLKQSITLRHSIFCGSLLRVGQIRTKPGIREEVRGEKQVANLTKVTNHAHETWYEGAPSKGQKALLAA